MEKVNKYFNIVLFGTAILLMIYGTLTINLKIIPITKFSFLIPLGIVTLGFIGLLKVTSKKFMSKAIKNERF